MSFYKPEDEIKDTCTRIEEQQKEIIHQLKILNAVILHIFERIDKDEWQIPFCSL